MRRITKLNLIFVLLMMISITGITAANMRIPHDGTPYSLPGASATAEDYQANTAITYWTAGRVTSNYYTMTVYVKYLNGVVLPTAQASSSKVGETKTASFFTNTAAGHIAHYHDLFAAMYMR